MRVTQRDIHAAHAGYKFPIIEGQRGYHNGKSGIGYIESIGYDGEVYIDMLPGSIIPPHVANMYMTNFIAMNHLTRG